MVLRYKLLQFDTCMGIYVLSQGIFVSKVRKPFQQVNILFFGSKNNNLNKKSLFFRILVQKCFVEVTEKNEKSRVYLKPSEMLNTIESYMKVLMSIENHGSLIYYLVLIILNSF